MNALFTIIVCFAVNSVLMKVLYENKQEDNTIFQLSYNNKVINGIDIERVRCSIHCVLCERDGQCLGCEVGYYGQTCVLKCLMDCGPKGCKQNTGTCNDTSISTTQPQYTSDGYTSILTTQPQYTSDGNTFIPTTVPTSHTSGGNTSILTTHDQPQYTSDGNTFISTTASSSHTSGGDTSVPTTTPFKHTSHGKQTNCSIHCVLCERGGTCLECDVGYYGPACSMKCLMDCGPKGCKQNTGTCDDTSIPTTTTAPLTSDKKTPIPSTTSAPHKLGEKNHKIGIIVCAVGGSALVIVVVVIFIIYKKRSQKSG